MNIQHRLVLLQRLGQYMQSSDEGWMLILEKASRENGWFTPEFIQLQVNNIAEQFLQKESLQLMVDTYQLSDPVNIRTVGLIMAGNLPLVGFHDFLCIFLSGHKQAVKMSSKDNILFKHLAEKLISWDPEVQELVKIQDMLKGCDAYIATGSDNSARYFDYYFSKYPSIIRKNRTSVAVLDGNETMQDLEALADDVYQFFGLGCRNVTKIYVPREYDFVPLLEAFKKYNHLFDHHKYKNNYDYQLAILIINRIYYMTNGSIILRESTEFFSPISVLHYEFYDDIELVKKSIQANDSLQCVVGKSETGFGEAQHPGILDFADGIDTMEFLISLQ
jgi:hypothetical protein